MGRVAIMHNGKCTVCSKKWMTCNCWEICICNWYKKVGQKCKNPNCEGK